MNDMEKKTTARNLVMDKFLDVIEQNDGEQFDTASFAFATEVEGQEIWVEMTFKSKAFKDTKRSPAFDPFVAREEWQAILDERAQKKAQVEAKKAQRANKGKAQPSDEE